MRAAWYEKQGAAHDVMIVGTMPDPHPGPGEVRLRVAVSGINPGDVKKREDAFALGMAHPRVIPHSDGAGVIDAVGEGVPRERIGERVWCFGAQSYRPFGTAAEYVVLPARQAVVLPAGVDFQTGACLGIPALTAHRAVHAGGRVDGQHVLVQGGAGGVGVFALAFARRAGAHVIATVRAAQDERTAHEAGAHEVLCTQSLGVDEIAAGVLRLAPGGVHHIVEVAFDANIQLDEQVLALGGSIAAYATGQPQPAIPFWNLLFKNARMFLLGSDDFAIEHKFAAAEETNRMLAEGWAGCRIDKAFPLAQIAEAHAHAESRPRGRVVVEV